MSKKTVKNLIVIAAVLCVVIVLAFIVKIQTKDDYYKAADTDGEVIGTVTISISCDTVAGKNDSEYIPENGVILGRTEYDICSGDTVYDVLIKAVKEHEIQLDTKGSLDGKTGQIYVSGINYLYEFDFGELSGWVYHVNGVSPSVGCASYELSPGDNIEWLYTCNLGDDVK